MTTGSASAASGGTVHTEQRGSVAILTLSYPQRRNALSLPLREALAQALEWALSESSVRAIVLTGEGEHFCSGGDISSFAGITPAAGRTRMQRVHRVVRQLIRGEKPVIAAVEGHAAGAGLCIAADCDIVVASRSAKFSCTFNRIGLMPDLGGLWSIPQRMGLGRAKLLMMTGRVLDAQSAQAQGLVETLCEPGQALVTAVALAEEIAQVSPLSNAMVKSVLSRGPMPLEEVLAMETDGQAVLYATEDFEQGRTAFLEKRPPQFQGR